MLLTAPLMCVSTQQAHDNFFHTHRKHITALMDPSGLTQHAPMQAVITLHESSNEAPLLIRRFRGQGDVCVCACVCVCLAVK